MQPPKEGAIGAHSSHESEPSFFRYCCLGWLLIWPLQPPLALVIHLLLMRLWRAVDPTDIQVGDIVGVGIHTGPAVVGEMGVMIDIPRSATVTALVPTESLELDAPNFDRLAKAYPILHRVIAHLLSERLRATESRVGQSLPS